MLSYLAEGKGASSVHGVAGGSRYGLTERERTPFTKHDSVDPPELLDMFVSWLAMIDRVFAMSTKVLVRP